jgi:hypothetical protein
MTHSFQEVKDSFVDLVDFSKASKSFAKKTRKASKELGLVIFAYGVSKLKVRRADHTTITYTEIPNLNDPETHVILLTHAILNYKLHD